MSAPTKVLWAAETAQTCEGWDLPRDWALAPQVEMSGWAKARPSARVKEMVLGHWSGTLEAASGVEKADWACQWAGQWAGRWAGKWAGPLAGPLVAPWVVLSAVPWAGPWVASRADQWAGRWAGRWDEQALWWASQLVSRS